MSEVYVTVTGSDGITDGQPRRIGGAGWEGTFSVPANPSRTGPVTYSTQATALDDAGQSGFADGPQIYVAPVANQQPVVTNASVAPTSLAATGGEVTIRAEATDPDGAVDQVTAYVTSPDSTVTTLTMSRPAAGEPYEATWAAPANPTDAPVEHVVSVVAVDSEGASGSADAGSVTVAGVDHPPLVSGSSVTPSSLPATGGEVTVAATATDDHAVAEVRAELTTPGGATVPVTMHLVRDALRGMGTLPANDRFVAVQYAVKVTALDDAGQPGTQNAARSPSRRGWTSPRS